MKNIVQRSITGSLFVGVIVFSLLIDKYTYLITFSAAVVLSLYEFYTIMKVKKIEAKKSVSITVGLLFFVASFFNACGFIKQEIFVLFLPLLLLIFIVELFRISGSPIRNIAISLFGLVYIVLPFSLMSYLLFDKTDSFNYDSTYLLSFFILVWANDTFAYLSGMTLGRTKLFERISPKKTWEGTVGGAAITALIAYFLIAPYTNIESWNWIILAFIISTFGTIGDLIESMMKRSLGIKDSGTILPGHGGFLDRFDAVIFALPAFFAYLYFI